MVGCVSPPKASNGGERSICAGYNRASAIVNLDPHAVLSGCLQKVGTYNLEQGFGPLVLVLELNDEWGRQ